jgi:trehalose utilization protein
MSKPRITVWNEYVHEKEEQEIAKVYPKGIHGCIADFLDKAGYEVNTATLAEPEHGLTQERLDATDVLFWWGHMHHEEVSDEVVERVYKRVMNGMGLVVLHSGHGSKIFGRLCGTNAGDLKWREAGEIEIVWTLDPSHPIAEGVGEKVIIPHEETYGEPFSIPRPDAVVFASWFQGGEIFRSGCCFRRGQGRIFYFRPGHESFPVYHMPEIQHILINAANWANAPHHPTLLQGHVPPVLDYVQAPTFHS